MQGEQTGDVLEIDLMQLIKLLWRHIWIIILSAIICGGAVFAGTYYFVDPIYQASVKMYVNNSSVSVGNAKLSISSAELSAAKTLVDTYIVILKTRTTLNDVIEKADLKYSYDELYNMIEAKSVNGTEVFEIIISSKEREEARTIANTIAEIMPDKISSIVDGSSVRIVELAVLPEHRSSPSYTKNTAIGIILGILISSGGLVLSSMFDKLIRSEDYLIQNYKFPLLAVVPDINSADKSYADYYKK